MLTSQSTACADAFSGSVLVINPGTATANPAIGSDDLDYPRAAAKADELDSALGRHELRFDGPRILFSIVWHPAALSSSSRIDFVLGVRALGAKVDEYMPCTGFISARMLQSNLRKKGDSDSFDCHSVGYKGSRVQVTRLGFRECLEQAVSHGWTAADVTRLWEGASRNKKPPLETK